MNLRTLLIGAVLLTLAPVSYAGKIVTPEFKTGETRPVTIALLPIKADMVRRKIVASEEMVEESTGLAEILVEDMAESLNTMGYEAWSVTPELINNDPRLQELVVDANLQYEEVSQQLYRKPKRVKKRRYHPGEPAQLLAAHLGVDAVVFTKLNVHVAAAGAAVANAFFGGIGGQSFTGVSASFVDAQTGDIEAYVFGATGAGYKKIMEDPDGSMAQLAKNTFRKFYAAEPELRKTAGDDAVLEDLEGLLD